MTLRKIAFVIPAYHPSEALIPLVDELAARLPGLIVVIDDGSGAAFQSLFETIGERDGVTVLRHAVNLGKGAALKTGFNHALCAIPDLIGVVTADADGQHRADDIVRVAERLAANPAKLILGVRTFDNKVPLRSRAGNRLTRVAVRFLLGQAMTDTQTGLRGIPFGLVRALLRVPSNGYEFELDMLVTAKHQEIAIAEEQIATIYEPGNPTSHFNPLFDSMRIYFVLLRFGTLSLLTALLDNLIFFLVYLGVGNVASAQLAGRSVAVLFNYGAARRAVFLSRERHKIVLPRYLLLVICSGLVSYALIGFLRDFLSIPVIWAKIAAESMLFLANFVVQRDVVFTSKREAATDWDRYYSSTPFTAKLTRKYTASVLIACLKKFAFLGGTRQGTIVELGGANSCFLDQIVRDLQPRNYHVIDTNEYGLDLLRRRVAGNKSVHLHCGDAMNLKLPLTADAVFSTGLIEHFDAAGTRRMILAHFDLLESGGCAVISFPTPTWLYRIARGVTETFGLWKFPDERPIEVSEVTRTIQERGEVLFQKTLWPLVFTQRLIVARKTV